MEWDDSFDCRIEDDIIVCGAWNDNRRYVIKRLPHYYHVCEEFKRDDGHAHLETVGDIYTSFQDAFNLFQSQLRFCYNKRFINRHETEVSDE